MRTIPSCAAALMACVLFLSQQWNGTCAPRAPYVRVIPEAYHGWQGAYRLSNGVVDVIVVPSIGRIMAFQFAEQPQTNPLFNNAVWAGKPAPPAPDPADPKTFPTEWHNYGGDKVWPSEQSRWPKHQPLAWPPDPSFDTGPYQVILVPNGIRLAGPVSPYFGVRLVREITLARGQAAVTIRDTFLKAQGQSTAFPVGIWSISQVAGDSTIYLPLDTQGVFPGRGFTPLGDSTKPMPNWQIRNGLLTVTRPSNIGTKVGVDDRAGWAACLYRGNLLFSETFTRDPSSAYPDGGADAEVFTNGDDSQAYMELEVLGPLVVLRPRQTLSRQITWRLERLAQTPVNADDAAEAVQKAMRKHRR